MNSEKIKYALIETTNHCNLNCSFCNRNEVIGKLQHISVPKFIAICEKLKDQPIEEAKFTGMGEPYLHKEFDKLCEIFKNYFPKSFLIVATNCQYKIRPYFENSMRFIDLLYFSIDGYKESYEKYRPPSKWDKLINFLDAFKDLDRHGCRATINYVVNPGNVDDIKLVDEHILKKYDLEELRLNIAQEWSEEKSINSGYTDDQINYLKKNWINNIKGKSPWNYSDCFWPTKGINVTVDGRILMCPLNTGAASFGNILYQDVEEIRSSDKFLNVIKGCAQNNPNDHCKNCSYKELSPFLSNIGINNN